MRLYLLPISTRRTLLYCQKLDLATSDKKSLVDKAQARATKLWADWEQKEKGWQKTVVNYGNYALRRIPYEEWGLKSVPSLSAKRRDDEISGQDKVQVVYPETVLPTTKVPGVLQTLATERDNFHKSRMIYCFIGMPISAPFALVPIVPNLPFFYLVYRAWSHWRALSGGKHIQFLATNNLLALSPSPILDTIYQRLQLSAGTSPKLDSETTGSVEVEASKPSDGKASEEETMLLSQANGKELVKALEIPELEVEIERALWQVEEAIREKTTKSSPSESKAPKADKEEK